MAKRGPKSTSTSNAKGRPRTRSQIKPSETSASPSQSPVKKPKEKKPAASKGSNKKAKATIENIVEKVSPTKVAKAKAKVEKEKKEPKKRATKKATKNTVDLDEKPAKAPVKRTRKPKAKNITSAGDEQSSESKASKAVKFDNDDTEDEEMHPVNHHAPLQLYGESTNQNYFNASSYNASSGPVHQHQAATSHITPHTPLLPPGGYHAHASTSKTPFQFESSLEKLQQETMAPKPFNVNNQEANYLSPLYPNATLTSSSTSAFSAPTQPKHYHQSTVTHSEASHSNMLSPSPMSSVNNMSHQASMALNHQNLLSPPQNSNPGPDLVHDLPLELLQQGWRKFWSKRENRPYYFNKNSNESLWELPKMSSSSGHYDPTTDPLGIQAATNNTFPPSAPADPGVPPIYPLYNPAITPLTQARNNDQALINGKKPLIGPFEFEIESNCFVYDGVVIYYYFHAHPETELSRCNFINKLRQQYYELCHTRESIEPPKDSFTRWILERKITDKGCDPFLPSDCPSELSKTLYNEIMNDIPIKQINPKFSAEARKQLSKYAEAAKKIIDSPHVSADSRKIVKWNVEDAFEWIRKTLNATYDDYIQRLEHLKKQCQPHIVEAARASVESICLKIYHVSVEYSKRIREQNLEIFKKEDLRERPGMRAPNQRKICYPAYLINPCPKLPTVQMYIEKETNLLRYKGGELLRLSTVFIQKLELLYFFNCRDDRKYLYFLTRVWCMVKRYQTFFNKSEGIASQHSLPLSVFASLNKHFGVTFECFASPLNCYFRQYCSLFPDTDNYFGSRGSILNFWPVSGSFQAHPPDCEELIDATVSHIDEILDRSQEPLSFILFIQELPETTQKIIPKLESNKFKRNHLTIPALEHEYRHGFQYVCNPSEVVVNAQYNMLVYFLQNDAGFLKWGPTPERVEELVESFKLGQDKELPMMSPPATPANNQKPETEIRPNGNENKDLTQ